MAGVNELAVQPAKISLSWQIVTSSLIIVNDRNNKGSVISFMMQDYERI